MKMKVPPLWHFRCAEVSAEEFISWNFARLGVSISAYRAGAWPVIKCEEVTPAKLGKDSIQKGCNGMLIVICPLCYDVSVFEAGTLKNGTYTCPGHAGSAICPGFVYGVPSPDKADISPGAICSIQ
jgi:hypothetical protein